MHGALFTATGSTDAQIVRGDVGVSLVPAGESRNYTCEASDQLAWMIIWADDRLPLIAITAI